MTINLLLSESEPDIRSDEKSFILKIENKGVSSINLISTKLSFPKGAKIETEDLSSLVLKAKHDEICRHLTISLNDELFFVDEIMKNRLEIIHGIVDEIIEKFKGWFGIFRLYAGTIFKPSWIKYLTDKYEKRFKAVYISIEDYKSAQCMFDKFLDNKTEKTIKDIFSAKLMQLKEIEDKLSMLAISTIESGSSYEETFIVRFPRNILNTKKFSISVECILCENDQNKKDVKKVSVSVIISPKPYILTIISILSSLLGTILKFSIAETLNNPALNFIQIISGKSAISAIILSAIFYNVYEYTDFGDKLKIKMNVSWRSALLIGTLCGLFSDRVISLLKALIGT